jgi:Tfp pilus assembly protein PilX
MTARATRLRRSGRRLAWRAQRGIVVFVALIAVVLMSLAAVGLMRSVHTNTMVVGNLAFRQASAALSSSAVEKAVYDMFPPTKSIPDLTQHFTARNYYAFRQPGENAQGIPAALQGNLGGYPVGAQVISDPNDPSGQSVARYVIERMCLPPSLGLEARAQFCEMIPPKQSLGTTGNVSVGINVPDIPYYRMTVRVDGPNNSVAFWQAMLR